MSSGPEFANSPGDTPCARSKLQVGSPCSAFGLWIAVCAVMTVTACTDASAAEIPQELIHFRDQRASMLARLVTSPLACVVRNDTDHPVFHGCIDWHSSVHGVWSIVAVGSALHDNKLIEKATTLLNPRDLETERQFLQDHPKFEMPYGRAWFLRLAVDFQSASGDSRLTDMSDDVAASLAQYLFSRPIHPGSLSYESDTWALINLHYYAAWRKDEKLLTRIQEAVTHYYALIEGPCPALDAEAHATDFMPICTNWAWLVSMYMKPEKFRNWASSFLPPTAQIMEPVTDPSTPHHHGIDFSRAWGLWAVYWSTSDPRYLRAYLADVTTALDNRDWWAGDYETVSHWVAQFGILAIYPTYQDYP